MLILEVETRMCRECGCEPHRHEEGHKRPYRRRFLTKEEKIERLQDYAEELKKELTAVQEQIKELKS